MGTNLKPCPFCGGEAKGYWSSDVDWFYVKCDYCGARTPPAFSWDEAISNWNKRTNVDDMEDDGR